jgi:CBS domain-containing protein
MPRDEATRPKTAADAMTPSPRTCSHFSSVAEAILIFRDEDCGAVPVLEDGKPVGVITDRDVALAVPDHPDLASLPVAAIMTKDVVAVPPDAPLDEVLEQFADRKVRRLLVIDKGGRLLGIIAWADIVPHVSAHDMGEVVAEVVEQEPAPTFRAGEPPESPS